MINTVSPIEESLDIFVDSLIGMPESCLSPAAIAEWFSFTRWLSNLPRRNEIIESCFDFVEDIQKIDLPEKLRGIHSIYGNNIQIFTQRNQSDSSVCFTLLHEIFEITVEKFNQKSTFPYELTDRKADLFAASVLMPKEAFLKLALKSDLDFQLILKELPHVCNLSLLIRLRHLFQSYKTYHLGVIAENKKAHYHENFPCDRNKINNFGITTVTRSPKDCITFNNRALEEILSKCFEIIMSQNNKDKKTITIEEDDLLIKASPLMYHKYNAIKTIIMQIVLKEDYQILLKEMALKKSAPYYTREYLFKNREIKIFPYQMPYTEKMPEPYLILLKEALRKL